MSTTLNKLEYTDETKKQIKTALNTNFNAGITDNDTFRSYVTKIKTIYTNWQKVTDEGTDLTLNGTKKGKMVLGLKGNTSQESTTGKNKLNVSENFSFSGATRLNTSISSGTYKLVWTSFTKGGDNSPFIRFEEANVGVSMDESSPRTITFSDDVSTVYFYSNGYNYSASQGVTSSINQLMLIPSTETDTSYEPYTNGASPNPDFPQDIHVVTGENSVKVQSQNFFNPNNIIQQVGCTINNDEITITDNSGWGQSYIICGEKLYAGQYTCSVYGNSGTVQLSIRGYKDGQIYEQKLSNYYSYISYYKASNQGDYSKFDNKLRFTLLDDCDYYYPVISLGRVGTETIKIKVEKERIDNPTYTPHAEQNYPVNLGSIELCKISDCQDYLYRENSKWYKHKEIEKIELDGTENWASTDRIDGTTKFFVLSLTNRTSILSTQQTTGELSDKFIQNNPYIQIGNYFWVYDNGTITVLRIGLDDNNIMTAQQIKEYISNNNFKVYYPLKEPTDIEITDTTLIEQLEAIENAMSYDTQTNISQTNDDLPFIINASALLKGGN